MARRNADKDRTDNKPRGGKGKPRLLRGQALVEAAHDVLLKWSNLSPKTHPINISALAKELKVSRQALYDNHVDKEIARYKENQHKKFSSIRSTPNHKTSDQRIVELETQVKDLQEKLDGWIERWAAVEYNARMMGLNPDEIFSPLPNPQRAGTPRRYRTKSRRRIK
jgi:hypothetical protein